MSSHKCVQEAVQTDRPSGGLGIEERLTHRQEESDGPRGLYQTTIDDLPDDALLEIFGFYLANKSRDEWHTLVHVCRWWRNVVFASPRHLDLRLLCRGDRSVRAMLDIWPTLPIHVMHYHNRSASERGPKNIIAALEHPDRVRQISIDNFPGAWQALAAAMRVPFPELTVLRLRPRGTFVLDLLGGSAPRLRTIDLSAIPFPAIRDLLLSAGDLVHLTLERLELELLRLGIEPPQFHLDESSSPPEERAVLPALAEFSFEGMSDYLEDFVARVDTPVLSRVYAEFSEDLVFDIPHFTQFIGRARGFKLSKAPECCFGHSPSTDWEISSIALICNQLSPFFSLVKRLDLVVTHSPFQLRGIDSIESTLMLELFRPFSAIQGLYVSSSLVPLIAPALQEFIGERATEVLPNLRDLFLGEPVIPGSVQEAIQPFVDARRHSGRPIAIHYRGEKRADL
ncbi:hypothetical protein BC826DRAFT_1186718 [Russula brevipes]|nr:hypothetical protein BC826DRAFT_1186718 [Russula brevipes]